MKHQINGAGGVLVITLHQPGSEVSCLIDDLLLLGYGGSPVFMGPWGAAMSYFTGHLGEQRGMEQQQPGSVVVETTTQQQLQAVAVTPRQGCVSHEFASPGTFWFAVP